jgi:hypothetical protein
VANAGTVTVDFAAEVAKFNAQLKQVNDRVKSVESGFKSLEKVASTALKFFSVGIAANFIRSAAEAADALGKTADKLGLSTERLAAFQLAAADAGVETGTLNKLLTDAQRRLGEAASGTGATYDALKSLGLGVRDLQKLSPDELFLRYSDAINSLKSRAEQFSVAQDLFGKSAQEAFTLIAAGRPAIEEAAATVDRLGLALSRVDIAQIEIANDKLGLLAKVSQAFGQQLAAAIAPFVTEFVDRLTGVGVAADDTRSKLDEFARAVFISFEIVANAARTFDLAVSAAFTASSKAYESAFAILRKSLELTAALDEAVGLDSLAAKFRGFAEAAGRAEAFSAAFSEQAAIRVANAANSIKSFAQILDEADQIVARSQARAEEAAANQAALASGLTGESRIAQLEFSLNIEAEILRTSYEQMLAEQVAFEQVRANISEQFDEDAILRSQETQAKIANSTIEAEKKILSFKQQTFDAGIGLLSALAGKSKAAALALIAFEKIRAIAQAKINTAQAVTNALANVPYPANLAAAAQMAQLGALQIGLIAATGLAEASNVISSSSGGAPIGSPQNPVFTDTRSSSGEQVFGAQQKSQVSIRFEGVFTAAAAREIAEQIREVIDNSDIHIIGPNSSNARELRGE